MGIFDRLSDEIDRRTGTDVAERRRQARNVGERMALTASTAAQTAGKNAERLAATFAEGDAPNPRARDVEKSNDDSYYFYSAEEDVNREEAPDDISEVVETYDFPLAREPIRNFASEVVEPGYQVHAEDDAMQELLEEWAEKAGIRGGEMGHNLTPFVKDEIINRWKRGTSLIEHSPSTDGDDPLAGVRLISPESVRVYKRPGQNILLRPDDPPTKDKLQTPNGTAAYVQYDTELNDYDDEDDEIAFTQEEITKVTIDCDTGDAFGNPPLASAAPFIRQLRKKLKDNNLAIETKGYPIQIYRCGDPDSDEGVWPDDKVEAIAKEHRAGNFSSGKKHFVPGDLDVDVVEGEVADIEWALMFDVENILASMPTPKYKVAFESDVNQFVVQGQETAYDRLVDEERERQNEIWSSIFQKKADYLAEEYDELSAEGVSLTFEAPPDKNPLARDQFDAEKFDTLMNGIATWKKSGAEVDFPRQFIEAIIGADVDELIEEYGLEWDDPAEEPTTPEEEEDDAEDADPAGEGDGVEGEDGNDVDGESPADTASPDATTDTATTAAAQQRAALARPDGGVTVDDSSSDDIIGTKPNKSMPVSRNVNNYLPSSGGYECKHPECAAGAVAETGFLYCSAHVPDVSND